jgi:hypothetical protein
MEDAVLVAEQDLPRPQALEHAGDGQPGRAGADDGHLGVGQGLALDLQGVLQGGADDDRSAVLIVVEDGDVQALLQHALHPEAIGRGDVFQVDPAEAGGDGRHHVDEVLGIANIHFDVKGVDVGEALEEQRLPFHHRLARQGAAVAQAQDRRAVAHDGDEVALGRVVVGAVGIGGDGAHGRRHSRRIGQGEVLLRGAGLARFHPQLARLRQGVVSQRPPPQVLLALRLAHGALLAAVTLAELLHLARRRDIALLAGIEGVALGAEVHMQVLAHGGAGLEGVAAATGNGDFLVIRMDVGLHLDVLNAFFQRAEL